MSQSQDPNPYRTHSELFRAESVSLEMDEPTTQHAMTILRMMQVISAALMAGVAIFSFVVLLISGQKEAPANTNNMPWLLSSGLGVMAIVAWGIFRLLPIKNSSSSNPSVPMPPNVAPKIAKALTSIQMQHLLSIAILEGAAFFGCIQFQLSQNKLCLLSTFVLIGVMAFSFPRWNWLIHRLRKAQ